MRTSDRDLTEITERFNACRRLVSTSIPAQLRGRRKKELADALRDAQARLESMDANQADCAAAAVIIGSSK